MKKIVLLFSFCLLFSIYCKAQLNIAQIDSIVQNAVNSNSFEGTVLIAENGKTKFHKSYGFQDEKKLVPTTIKTHFSIASITKMFTAIAILQLVEEGKIELGDNLKRILPKLKIPNAKKITVHHLLLHISGLPNEDDRIYQKLTSPEEFINQTLKKESGRLGYFNYANIDYVLLGLILEKFDKKTWQESIQDRILDKTKMPSTGFLEKKQYPENFANSYSFDNQGLRKIDVAFFIENYYASGNMYSNAQDLLKLDQVLYGEQLLTEESKEKMFTSYPEYNYSGYSVWTYRYPFSESQPKIMERRGGIKGATSVIMRLLDTNKTIIILSNNSKFNPDSFGNSASLKEALLIAVADTKS